MNIELIKMLLEIIILAVLSIIAWRQDERISVIEERFEKYDPTKAKKKLEKIFEDYLAHQNEIKNEKIMIKKHNLDPFTLQPLKKEQSFKQKIASEEKRMNKVIKKVK